MRGDSISYVCMKNVTGFHHFSGKGLELGPGMPQGEDVAVGTQQISPVALESGSRMTR